MVATVPVEVFPVGEHLAAELDARGWTQVDFAEVLGRPAQFVSEIISGKKEITRESAAQISAALGTSAEVWLSLQDAYLLWRQANNSDNRAALDDVKTRALLKGLAPVSLLVKRGYIRSGNTSEQANDVLRLFGMQSFDDEPSVRFAARRSNQDVAPTMLQRAWVACVMAAAKGQPVRAFSDEGLRDLALRLASKTVKPSAFASFQERFAKVGVRLVYVESFPGGKLDGCAFFDGDTPVIGVSGRGKRLDIILFTILHEVAHILRGDLEMGGGAIVDDLSTAGRSVTERPERELAADRDAASFIFPSGLGPVPARITAPWVEANARKRGVHPIVVVGRLQNDGAINWKSTLVREAPLATSYLEEWSSAL